MGIELSVEGDMPKRGLMRKAAPTEEIAGAIVEAIRTSAPSQLMHPFMYAGPMEGGVGIGLHPGADPLQFSFPAPGRVRATIKTSTVGPGLHEYAVQMLRAVEQAVGVRWHWTTKDGVADEFGATGDFDALQRTMAQLMQTMLKIARARAGDDAAAVAMNLGFGPAMPMAKGVLTPMGPLPWAWVDETIRARGDALLERAAKFYPWWESGVDGPFYRDLAITLMWTDVPWRAPANERESLICRVALASLEAARALEPHMPMPEAEYQELRAIVEAPAGAPPKPPRPSGIGYARLPRMYVLPGGWRVTLPGYFTLADAGGAIEFACGPRSMRIRLHGPNASKGRPTRDALLAMLEPDDTVEVLQREKGDTLTVGAISREADAAGVGLLKGAVATPGGVASCVLHFEQPGGESWARHAFASVRWAGGGPN
ncbi:MAG: hypothetical protein ACF8QF_06845 [Phycisphaerales bacterium]